MMTLFTGDVKVKYDLSIKDTNIDWCQERWLYVFKEFDLFRLYDFLTGKTEEVWITGFLVFYFHQWL